MRFVAGRGTVAERLQRGGAMAEHLLARGTVAENHREAFAGRGTVAERLQRGGAMAELLLARGAAAELHREEATAGKVRRATAGKERYCWK